LIMAAKGRQSYQIYPAEDNLKLYKMFIIIQIFI